jgi:hypothetical protein
MTDAPLEWRKSTYSGSSGECVEMAAHPDGSVRVRNSNHPTSGTLSLNPDTLGSWLAATKAGALDDLTD